MTDLERVRRDLIRRGIEGTSQDRFDPPYTADGGPPIPQIARRIRDLRAKGDAITTIKGVGYCRYVYTKYLSSGAGGVVVTPRRTSSGVRGFHQRPASLAIRCR